MLLTRLKLPSTRGQKRHHLYLVYPGFVIPILLLILAACGSAGNTTTAAGATGATATPTPSGPTVSISDNEFSPKQIHINPGDTVTWVNKGQLVHTVTADNKKFDSNTLSPGKTFSHTFTDPGTYSYYCTIHGGVGGVGMAGVVIVDSATNTYGY